jgi:outer membrane lipoprotein-sorting protein
MIRRRKALICLLALLVVASCRGQNDSPVTNNASSDTIISATPPFKTKEPERYRATRTITSVTDGKTKVTTYTIAKDGELRRFEAEFGSKKMIFMDLPEGKLVLFPDEKVYADQLGELPSGSPYEDESSPEKLLHTDTSNSSYQKLGTEAISGRNTEKYRVVVNEVNGGNVSSSETLIWIDEALGIPIKSETKSSDGSRSTMELSNISLEVDKNLFQVPNDYKKISFTDMINYLAKH